ncbi:MAG: diguanylate cyclase [Negativicutes bacterium]|nr:diguanylate cyclase [Negativicutes bacterium]
MKYPHIVKELRPEDPKTLKLRADELEARLASLGGDLLLSRTANKFLSSVLDTVDALVVVVDPEGHIVRLNQAFQQTVGDPGKPLDGKPLWNMFLLPDDIAAVRATLGKLVAKECRTATENYWLTKDGHLRLISWSFTALRDGSGYVNYVVGVGLDITEREQAEEDLRISKERYHLLFNNVNDAVFLYSLARPHQASRLIEVNEVACRRLGYSREELLRLSPADIEHLVNPAQKPIIARKLQDQNHALFEAVQVTKSGRQIPVEINAHLFSLHGEKAVLSVARDITERKEMEERLRFVTMHDSLTGLYNRTYFDEEINRLSRARDLRVGVFVCDVDGLKLINDSMGHQAGDALLKGAAQALRESVRDADFVARIGGDEFAVILFNVAKADMETVYDRIRTNIMKQNTERPALPLSVSIGYAVAAGPTQNMQQLIKEADDHMYREKLHRSQSTRSTLVLGLMKALEVRDFITEGHGDRMSALIDKLGKATGVAEHELADLRLLAQFHDFGKVGIPDRILFKPGRLTPKEYREMQRHCEIGHRIAKSVPDLIPIADRILKHHEWWNGKGYPLGLKGENIPVECRLLAIVDAYDAMTSNRPYRKAMSISAAMDELRRCKGTQFDPLLVESFEKILQ